MLKPQVTRALAELRQQLGETAVHHTEDGAGGAYVLVDEVDLGERFTPETRRTWIGFRILHDYPFSDIYPHFIRPDLRRRDGSGFGEGVSGPTTFAGMNRPALQVSRRSNRRDANTETAVLKLLKVIEWVRTKP